MLRRSQRSTKTYIGGDGVSYRRIIKCDVCGKEESLDEEYRVIWLQESAYDKQICSQQCFEKQYFTEAAKNQ